MPDVKPPLLCDYPSSPPAGCTPFTPTMDLEPCLTDRPSHPHPLALYPRHQHSVPPYPGLQGAPYPVMPRCNSSALLTNLGLRYCSSNNVAPSRQGPQRVGPGGLGPGPFIHTGAGPAGGRLYRSMESLNWNGGPEPGLYGLNSAPYGSVDSEIIFRCTATSHWYDGPPEGSGGLYGMVPNHEGLAFYPRRGLARKEPPLFPQWLFPGADEWDARKGLRDKLRLQSARSAAEPAKPLRPQVTPGATPPVLVSYDGHVNPAAFAGSRPLGARRITSPDEIKQEVLRRLQLRRQNSSPNLALAASPESPKPVKSTSFTTDSIAANGTGPSPLTERRRPPVERLHIPTFEEFKRMRRESESGSAHAGTPLKKADTGGPAAGGPSLSPSTGQTEDGGERTDQVETVDKPGEGNTPSCQGGCRTSSSSETTSISSPICTGPLPRSPLQPLASSAPERGSVVGLRLGVGEGRPRRSSLDPAGTVAFPPRRESGEGPSSCCPALLLDGTDLSSYGAKIYKMKDGIIGSALDLIMKSCSAEISAAEAPARLSADQDGSRDITAPLPPACHSPLVAMATPPTRARGAEACDEPPAGGGEGEEEDEDEEEEKAECQPSGLGCRRSSSDAAYEPAETVRAQRECRLRPHYSDPMPADAAKRKQLEMKIAAAARLHSQRRDRDRDRDSAPAAVRVRSEPRGEKRLGLIRVGQHRWSTVSSLSVDSGVVGLSDERIDDADGHEPRRLRRGGTEVERADSGIGPGLARGWKRPSASLRAWEAQRPCPDCGQRDGSACERSEAMCERCSKLRTERKEAISEFLNTETSYGEDLRIIKAEFYSPMQSAGLLTAEQLQVVFSNVQELIDVNERFSEHLQDSIDQAFDQGDEDLLTVCIGEIFLEFVNMLPAFQTYCLQQSTSVNMLNSLEKEKELLRIFLDVSQNDNTALRRMNLRSFLMAPLQRVTKYPLLLSRISKATTECHPDHGRLREAKSRVESHLEHINMKTKQEGLGGGGVTWSLRSFRRDSRKNREVINIEMREVSMKTVGWARESTRFVMEGPLQLAQPADGQWVKKGTKGLKFQNVQSLLMVRTQRPGEGNDVAAKGELQAPAPPGGDGGGDSIRDGVLVLIKDKSSGKFTVLREPIRLSNCVVSSDPDCEDTFEVLDIRKESFVFRASDKSRTQQWFRQIKRYARDLGPWRKRRNALPNIMINTTQIRS
ncbi:uncharacterized protein arhgef49 [Aplochiton taeniatus]